MKVAWVYASQDNLWPNTVNASQDNLLCHQFISHTKFTCMYVSVTQPYKLQVKENSMLHSIVFRE